VHGLGFLPTTGPTHDDETRRIDGSVHDSQLDNKMHCHREEHTESTVLSWRAL